MYAAYVRSFGTQGFHFAPKTNDIINQPAIASQTQRTELRYGTVNRAVICDRARAGLGPKLSHNYTAVVCLGWLFRVHHFVLKEKHNIYEIITVVFDKY